MKASLAVTRVVLMVGLGLALGADVTVAVGRSSASPPPGPANKTVRGPGATQPVSADTRNGKGRAEATRTGATVSSQIAELVKLKESGVETAVILTHVGQSTTAYPLNADEIIYLHSHGVPAEIITGFIRRGGELRSQAEQAAKASQSRTPKAAPVVIGPRPPDVQSSTPTAPAPGMSPVYVHSVPRYVYYPTYSHGWPTYWWWSSSYPYRPWRYSYTYPRAYYGWGRRHGSAVVPNWGRSAWAAPVRGGHGPPPHPGGSLRVSAGLNGARFSGPGPRR